MARDQLALSAGRVLWGNPSSTEAQQTLTWVALPPRNNCPHSPAFFLGTK